MNKLLCSRCFFQQTINTCAFCVSLDWRRRQGGEKCGKVKYFQYVGQGLEWNLEQNLKSYQLVQRKLEYPEKSLQAKLRADYFSLSYPYSSICSAYRGSFYSFRFIYLISFFCVLSGNTNRGGRYSTVDLLIRLACFDIIFSE